MTDQTRSTEADQAEQENEGETLQIGAFSGYNRRPIPDRSGMTAQVYGENGEDADMIASLSLTKYLDADIYVKIHLIKDAHGRIMKTGGAFPLVASFKGQVQRSKGLRDGMLANLFAPNGPDADQVNLMGLTKYMDALVYVEILKPEAAPAAAAEPALRPEADQDMTPELSVELEELSQHLTPFERKALAKKAKGFEEANRLLKISGFLRQPSVWSQVGSERDYQLWTEGVPCCAAGDSPCCKKSSAFKIPSETHQRYAFIPLCEEHAAQAEGGSLPGGVAFMRLRRDLLIQEWVWDKLKEKVGTSKGIDTPDPSKIFSWALEHGLSQHVPANYLSKFS